MSAYVDPRFRPTLWPGTVVPTPPLQPFKAVEVDGDWLLWEPAPSEGQPFVELPEDFYLRELMSVSADDLESIGEVFCSYGLLFDLNGDEFDLRDLDEEEREVFTELVRREPPGRHWPGGIHRDLVQMHLQAIQEAVRTWIACQHEGGLEELVAPNVTDEVLAEWQALNTHKQEAWPHSLDHLQALLIQLRIDLLEGALQQALGKFSVGLGDLADRNPTIYSVAFLQLYNHLAEGAFIRRCANENCGRNFVRQRGRAEYGQHRTSGVKYCSRECARAQAQRDLRRRRRQESNTP